MKDLPYSQELSKFCHSLKDPVYLKPLIESVKDKQVVLLGECTHGTSEFYHLRKLISLELIKNHGFNLMAVEGEWGACQRIHQFLNDHMSSDYTGAVDILKTMNRWPTWMLANLEMEDFL